MITIPSYNTRITYEDSVLQAHLPFPILTYSLNMRTKHCFGYSQIALPSI